MLQSINDGIFSAECFFFQTLCNLPKITANEASATQFIFKYACVLSDDVFFLISPLDRREAVLLPSLQQGFRGQVQSQGSPTDPFGCEKIPMQELLQNLLQDVSSAQAWGIWLLCSTLNWDTFPPPEKKRKPSVAPSFFQVQENCQGIVSRGFVPKTFFLRAVDFISEREIALCSRASRFKQCFCDCNQCRALSYHVLTYLCYSCTFLHV